MLLARPLKGCQLLDIHARWGRSAGAEPACGVTCRHRLWSELQTQRRGRASQDVAWQCNLVSELQPQLRRLSCQSSPSGSHPTCAQTACQRWLPCRHRCCRRSYELADSLHCDAGAETRRFAISTQCRCRSLRSTPRHSANICGWLGQSTFCRQRCSFSLAHGCVRGRRHRSWHVISDRFHAQGFPLLPLQAGTGHSVQLLGNGRVWLVSLMSAGVAAASCIANDYFDFISGNDVTNAPAKVCIGSVTATVHPVLGQAHGAVLCAALAKWIGAPRQSAAAKLVSVHYGPLSSVYDGESWSCCQRRAICCPGLDSMTWG